MDFRFFENLTSAEAELFLENFLRESALGFQESAADLDKNNIAHDFSLASIPAVFEWIKSQIQTFPICPDETLPDWIRTSEVYEKSLFELDESSNVLILRFAYYLGECFARASPKLRWTTGNKEYAQQKMPVISGFKHKKELAPMMVAQNLFRRVFAGHGSVDDVRIAVQRWRNLMPV